MAESDIVALRGLGWSDEAIYFTIMVVALFNFYNRWVTTSGVHPVRMKFIACMASGSR